MDRLPFGIRRLDTTIGGGAPPGSVVLLSGEAGAGVREFAYTVTVMNGLADADEDRFDLYYGGVDEGSRLADEVHYVTFATSPEQVRREMSIALEDETVSTAAEAIEFHDLSPEYFRLSPVPREWYAERSASIADLGRGTDRASAVEALGDRLSEHAAGNLVVIDSLTDLISAAGEEIEWYEIPQLLSGIVRAAHEWGGMILVLLNHETLTDTQHGKLVDSASGTLLFEWETGGSTRARTLVVRQFRGVLSRIEEENIVRFETEIGDTGFDISDVRKIR